MKVKLINILMMAVVAAGVCSCSDDELLPDREQPVASQGLVISAGSLLTRGDTHYTDDDFAEGSAAQEETIGGADLYFFKSSTDRNAAFYHLKLDQINKITTADLKIKMPLDKIKHFELTDDQGNPTAYVYALVNLPSGTDLPADESATLEELQQVWVTTSDFSQGGVPGSFVMRGGNNVRLEGTGKDAVVKGWIPVERLASKVRLFAGIHDVVYLDEYGKTIYQKDGESDEDFASRLEREKVEEWHSRPTTTIDGKREDNVWLYMSNFTTNGRIDGYTGYTGKSDDRRDQLLTYASIPRSGAGSKAARLVKKEVTVADYQKEGNNGKVINRTTYPYTHETAYYSYPNQWDSSNIEERHMTYVTMRVTWERTWSKTDQNSGTVFENFYYQIPVNRLKTSAGVEDVLEPNMYYRIKIDIGMLGSKELGSPLEIEGSYEVVPWRNEPVNVNIKNRRYLVVNETNWTMNNVSQISIPFSSSHDVEISECYVTYFRYNDVWGTDDRTVDRTNAESAAYGMSHNSGEYDAWLTAAQNNPNVGQYGEGYLEGVSFDNKVGEQLYYRPQYLFDSVLNNFNQYYMGMEHPKTIDITKRKKDSSITDGSEEGKLWKMYTDTYGTDLIYDYWIDEEKGTIVFNHPLVQWEEVRENAGGGKTRLKYYKPVRNRHNSNRLWDEFSRVEIVMKVRHKDRPADEHLFEETIYITQYPGVYVEVSHNYGGINTAGGYFPGLATPVGNEYVFANGNGLQGRYGTGTSWYETTAYVRFYSDLNNNPNMYVIHTTQLSEENEILYTIGDPRKLTYNFPLDNTSIISNSNVEFSETNKLPYWTSYRATYRNTLLGPVVNGYESYTIACAKAPRIYDGYKEGYLTYYYPTDETSGAGSKENFIAPTFRVASSFGKVNLTYSEGELAGAPLDNYSREDARRRCAVYQEAGRPAGRWRVPTKAEIEYLVNLSADGKIPYLFGVTKSWYNREWPDEFAPYWAASGLVGVNAKQDKVKSMQVSDFNTNPAVRCVYDDWYWDKIDAQMGRKIDPKDTQFKWGDMPKDNTQH